jgi:hypothetical protein
LAIFDQWIPVCIFSESIVIDGFANTEHASNWTDYVIRHRTNAKSATSNDLFGIEIGHSLTTSDSRKDVLMRIN